MKKLLMCLVLSTSFILGTSSLSYAGDPCKDDPRECFDGFGDDDTIEPKDPKVKRTFDFPAVKAGFIIDFKDTDVLPHLSVEAFDFSVPKIGDFAVDVGVANSRVFAALTWEVIPVVKVGPSIWAGYNVKEQDPAFGIGISILDF